MNPEHILKIRTSKDSIRSLAKQYGVSPSTIANIKAGRTYLNPYHCSTCGQLLPTSPSSVKIVTEEN